MHKSLSLVMCVLFLSACAPDVVRHNQAGNGRFAENAYDEAIDEYRLAQVADPDRAEPYYNAANAYNRTERIDAALAQTEQALKTADPALAARAWYNLGNAYFDAEQWPQAVEAYKEALRLQPDDEDAKHNLELALQKLQEQQQQSQDQNRQDQERQEQTEDEQQTDRAGATPTPESAAAPSEEQETDKEQPPAGEQEDQQMTPEQALQLLQAVLGDSETLQERLQQIYQVPGPPPVEDW